MHLLDDQTFEIISSFQLDLFGNGCFILSCSFLDDKNVYYCLDIAYVMPEENELPRAEFLYSLLKMAKFNLLLRKKQKALFTI